MIVIDGDHVSYRSAASCEPTKAKPFLEPKETAIWRVHAMMETIQLAYNNLPFELYLSGEGNWRKAIYPEYKANRASIPRPTYLEDVREILVSQYKATIVNDNEVDDACGIRLTQLQAEGVDAVCASLDKDLLQVPGRHYSWEIRGTSAGKQWMREAREVRVSPLDGLRTFYKQVITGDASDNVPSWDNKYRSATPKFVQEMLLPLDDLDNEQEMWEYVLSYYTDKNIAARNASILYIKRSWEDYWREPS